MRIAGHTLFLMAWPWVASPALGADLPVVASTPIPLSAEAIGSDTLVFQIPELKKTPMPTIEAGGASVCTLEVAGKTASARRAACRPMFEDPTDHQLHWTDKAGSQTASFAHAAAVSALNQKRSLLSS